MNFPECRRCKKQKPEHVVLGLPPNPSLSFGSTGPVTLEECFLPSYETVCLDCLADQEVAKLLRGVTIFCLEQLMVEEAERQRINLELITALMYVRTYLSFEMGMPPLDRYRTITMAALRSTFRLQDQMSGYHRCIQCAALRHESELYCDRETHDWACVDPKHGRGES